MTDKERTIKELKEALDSLDITNKYRLNLIRAIEYLQDEPVSEELENATQTITYKGEVYTRCYKDKLDAFACKYHMSVPRPSKRYAKYSDVDLTIAVKDGAKWQKNQLMANAVDTTVHIDAGGYPYIPQIELYDYDKDIPLAKEGDKYKVILIKEE